MTDSLQKQTAAAIVTAIQALDLEGIQDDEIVARKVAREDTHIDYGITVSWEDEREARGTNERDDIGYPFVVTMCQGTSRGATDEMAKLSKWRENIRRTFHNKRLTGISSTGTNVIPCTVQHRDVTVPKEYLASKDVSQLVITAWFRESRTVVA